MAATDLFTLADLADQVCQNVGATDDITQAKARKNINRALIRFSEMGKWTWQRVYAQAFPATVNGTRTYAVTGCLEMTSLYMSSPIQRRLVRLDDRDYRRRYPNDTAVGTPYYYLERGRSNASLSALDTLNIGLYPVPDAVYSLKWDGVKAITLLTNDTDDIRVVTGMPVNLVDIVIEMATAIQWKEIDDADAATQMQEVLFRLKAAYAEDCHGIDDIHVMAPFDGENLDKLFDPSLPPNFSE